MLQFDYTRQCNPCQAPASTRGAFFHATWCITGQPRKRLQPCLLFASVPRTGFESADRFFLPLPELIEQPLHGRFQLLGGLVGTCLQRAANLFDSLTANFARTAEVVQ